MNSNTGFILCVDIVDSTRTYFEHMDEGRDGEVKLAGEIAKIMQPVSDAGGVFLTFRGDGFLALIRDLRLGAPDKEKMFSALKGLSEFGESLRVAVHHGLTRGMETGPLARQFLGRALIIAVRVCDYIGNENPNFANEDGLANIVMTRTALSMLVGDSTVHNQTLIEEHVKLDKLSGTVELYRAPLETDGV